MTNYNIEKSRAQKKAESNIGIKMSSQAYYITDIKSKKKMSNHKVPFTAVRVGWEDTYGPLAFLESNIDFINTRLEANGTERLTEAEEKEVLPEILYSDIAKKIIDRYTITEEEANKK